MRKLASIQKISKLKPIEDADFIEVAEVLGWNLIVKKGEFKVGDLCIYFETDSLLPIRKEYDFLAKNGIKLHALLKISEIAKALYDMGAINEENLKTILKQIKK